MKVISVQVVISRMACPETVQDTSTVIETIYKK